MYLFIIDGFQFGLWDWWSKFLLDVVIFVVNVQLGINFNVDILYFNGLIINFDMFVEKVCVYIDIVFIYYNFCVCQIFQLEECVIVDIEDIIDDILIELVVVLNFVIDYVFICSNVVYLMEVVQVYDINGRYISVQYNIDNY